MQKRTTGTRINLEQAIAILIQNQAAFLAGSRETDEWRRKADERFARIERELAEIKSILNQFELILNQLPELIRQKIGFKAR
jgi:hypothetical protein